MRQTDVRENGVHSGSELKVREALDNEETRKAIYLLGFFEKKSSHPLEAVKS